MSITNDIKLLLDIQDENITFGENCVTKGNYKGSECTFVDGWLSYKPNHCTKCGIKNEDYIVIKNGTQTSRITLPSAGLHPVYLRLKKQRFLCKACGYSFTAKTNLVNRNCFISNHTKMQIMIQSAEAKSLIAISQDCAVSAPTVQRVINEAGKMYKPHYSALPTHLSFDEFKYAKGKMAFEYINVLNGDILDILDQRTNKAIKDHFIGNYALKDRKSVKTVTIDMNAGYVSVIKEIFPNAAIIIDRFHLVQLINRSMNKCRIKVMNSFKTSNGEDLKRYRRLKAYWKLILKKESDLSSTDYKFYRMFGQRLETVIVDELLSYSETLQANYRLYQDLLYAMSNQDFKAFESILNQDHSSLISSYMQTSLKTLRKHAPYIANSFIYTYNNGRIEGINNKIKVLNRVAYGYRNFTNYKNRILLHFKLRPVDAINKQTSVKVS